MPDPDIMTISQAAKLLRIGERSAYQLAREWAARRSHQGRQPVAHRPDDARVLDQRRGQARARGRVINKKAMNETVLDALLDKYANEGLVHVEAMGVLRVQPLSETGTIVQPRSYFDGKDKDGYLAAVRELEAALHANQVG